MSNQTLSTKLIQKLGIVFFLAVIIMAASYILTTIYLTNKHYEERSQKLNAQLAQHLIDEKFQSASPFLEDGTVNKPLFGDLMHDMMAVNRGIEVYLLNSLGAILYSVVLSHDDPNDPVQYVNLEPVEDFIACGGDSYILGDDPRDRNKQKIFSAAPFQIDGRSGYIYIVLAGQELQVLSSRLLSDYFLKLGVGASLITMIFVLLLGFGSMWFLTKNIRILVDTVKRFREGDMDIRIAEPEKTDLSILATNFNEMADTLKRNMEEIKSVDVLRRELIANVSHDLRTPLAIINGYIETLQIKKDQLDEEEKDKYLEVIKGSSEKLSKLVAQLFEYSKLEAEQVKPEKEPFPITELAMDLIAKYQILAEEKDISISLETHGSIPLVFADIGLVERVIQNLLDNALKFTPQGGEVGLAISASEKDVQVQVHDTGPGIKEAEQKLIFDRYRQSRRQSKSDGVGLGLAIVKKIVELHNSSVQVISKPNQGSTFQFSLPTYQIA